MLNTNIIHRFIFFLITLTTFIHCYSMDNEVPIMPTKLYLEEIYPDFVTIKTSIDSSFQNSKNLYEQYINKQDTITASLCLLELADIERLRGRYEESFDYLWQTYSLLQTKPLHPINIRLNRNLGILYSIYNKEEETLKYLKSALFQAKTDASTSKVDSLEILHCQFSLSYYYRNKGNYDKALNYLDSCQSLFPNQTLPYVEADKGLIHLKKDNYTKAQSHLYKVKNFFLKGNEPYQVVYLSFLGDLKVASNETDSAMYFYTKSLSTLSQRQVYLEYKPLLLEKLSKVYLQKGQCTKAYETLNQSKQSMDSIFNVTNNRNNKLFEIKNNYQEKLIQNENIIQNQNQTISRKEKIQQILFSVLLGVITLSIFLLFFFRQRLRYRKLETQRQFEKEKANSILKVKSKELTAYALQIIEKEQAIKELLEIAKASSTSKAKGLESKYLDQSKKLWDSFNKRFLDINSDFYTSLKEKHPDLSPSEQKHCALIRLNFDNSEMAQILSISLQAVHTSRYRIRKKIGLERNESLDNYIADL